MRAFEKFVVCLALLLVALAAAFARPLPALAVWGDDDEPLPEVLGLQLGGDIRKYPDLKQQSFEFPENWGKGATYEGIRVYPRYCNIFDYKISALSFLIKVKDFPRFRKIMRRKFGNEILRGYGEHLHAGYYWGKYEMEILALHPFRDDMAQIIFKYLPLSNKSYAASHDIPDSFTYHGVTLGQKPEEYPFLHPIKEEAPGIVYYQSSEPPLTFDKDRYWDVAQVESETWLAYQGVIYSLELRGKTEFRERFMARELMDMYKPKSYSDRVYSSSEVRLGDYTVYFKGPGLTVMTHMPTYWRILRAKIKLGK